MGVDELLAQPIANGRSLVGRRIGRHFPGHGRFEGAVCAWEAKKGYRLKYDDGDEESQIPLAEVLRLLLPDTSGKRAKKRPRPVKADTDQ